MPYLASDWQLARCFQQDQNICDEYGPGACILLSMLYEIGLEILDCFRRMK